MLTARKAPRACQSCRLQLLSLFENGFTKQWTSHAQYSTYLRPRSRVVRFGHSASTRRFTAGLRSAKDPEPQSSSVSPQDLESVVREARQTFGETLPKDYLSPEEYILYERLYGPPLRETKADDLEFLPGGEEEEPEKVRNVLLRENSDGEYEEIELDPGLSFPYKAIQDLGEGAAADGRDLVDPQGNPIPGGDLLNDAVSSLTTGTDRDIMAPKTERIHFQGRNQREIDAISQLQKDMAAMEARPTEEEEEEEEEDIDEEYDEDIEENEEEREEPEPDAYLSSDSIRTHPHTMAGRSGTFPTTISLPDEHFIEPISDLLERTNMKHLSEAAEKLFGGPGLPHSPSTRRSIKHLPQTHIPLDASQHRMTEIEADAYISAVMPGIYAPIMGTLVEVRKRLGASWLRNLLKKDGGPRILDAGAAGAGAIAWREIAQAEWDVLREEKSVSKKVVPAGKTTVLVGADKLRHRVSGLFENTTFLPRLPDYLHSSKSESHIYGAAPQARKNYDVIIAPHTLFRLKEDFRRKNMVENLWSLLDPNGGVLILIEKGIPRGFEAIGGARSHLLEKHIASPGDTTTENEIQSPASDHTRFAEKEEGMIIAPCTNHLKCPMYLTPGLSPGRKDFCHFSQRFLRPGYLQQVLGASKRNHEDILYSYLAVRRGVDARKGGITPLEGDTATDQSFEGYEEHDLPDPELEGGAASTVKFNALSLPRSILPPLKRRGHVTLDLCTPSGKLERWTVPKSFSRTAYRDARKSRWGDLWALGAKTRVLRSPRLGRPAEEGGKGGKVKGIRDGRMGKGGKKAKKNQLEIIMGQDGFRGIQEARSQSKFVRPEKRTKGGRIFKAKKPIGEDDL